MEDSRLDHPVLAAVAVLRALATDGYHHTPFDLSIVIIGSGCRQAKAVRHVKYPLNTPFINFWLILLDKVGVTVDQISDSTGRLISNAVII
jgi:hypothetical protein